MGPVPSGKGVFISNVTGAGSPQDLIRICKEARIGFVAIGATSNKLAEYSKALKKAGIQVWIWGYPEAGREVAFVNQLVSAAKTAGAIGIIPDPEVSYQGNPVAAEKLNKLVLEKAGNLGIGFTTYGHAYLQGRFPWREFSGLGWGCPQVYLYASQHPGSTLQSIQSWKEKGWRDIVPAIPVWRTSADPMTSQQLISLLNECKRGGSKGVIAWNLFHKENYPDLWETFKNYRW